MSRTLLMLAAALVLALRPAPARAQPDTPRRDLSGTLSDDAGGPVPGAIVRVWQGWPLFGPAPWCPEACPDCGKTTPADDDGRFVIGALNATQEYAVLAAAPGFEPLVSRRHDTADGPLHLRLKRRAEAAPFQSRPVRGRILGADGQPLDRAVVEAVLMHREDADEGIAVDVRQVETLALTNDRGEFTLTGTPGTSGLDVIVRAPAHAQGYFPRVPSGGTRPDLSLVVGASIRGRLTKDGEPVPNVELGLCSTDRTPGANFERHTLTAGSDGRFQFDNITPGREYAVYTLMGSATAVGAAAVRTVRAGADKTVTDIGEVALAPGHTVTGRLVMPQGASLVLPARVGLAGEVAWDVQAADVKPDGSFELRQVPGGLYTLIVAMKGFQPSEKNHSYWTGQKLRGVVDADLTGLTILMAPPPSTPSVPAPSPPPPAGPLRGTEGSTNQPTPPR